MGGHTTSVKEQTFRPFAAEIDQYYREKFGYKTQCAWARYPTVNISRAPVRLYLRFRPGGFWPDDSVVIASIEFRKQRRGNGAELLKKLVEMSDRYQFNSIGIEQTGNDKSIQNFVRKFGFKNHRNDSNWLVSIKSLKKILALLPPSIQDATKLEA